AVTKRLVREVRAGYRGVLDEDGADCLPEIEGEVEPEGHQIIEDLDVLDESESAPSDFIGDTPPEVQKAGGERLLVSVPASLYKGGTEGKELVLVPESDLPWELTAEKYKELCAEAKRL